jgi:hypothetical protein
MLESVNRTSQQTVSAPSMLLTTRINLADDYFEALEYLNRMKAEGKYNENSVGVFTLLYEKQVDILVKQGYFKPVNN